MKPNENSYILPTSPESMMLINSQEEVYKSALEIILSLCEGYAVSLMDIKAICETVLRRRKINEQ